MKSIVQLTRPHQWVKNIFVLLPLFFSGSLFHPTALYSSVITMLSFCFIASSVYCFNDIYDVEADRKHDVKCARPIASGRVSITTAYLLMALMLAIGVALAFLLPENRYETLGILMFYYGMNLCYCAKLKQYAIIDVCIVAFGFVLRILSGGVSSLGKAKE